MSASLPTLPPGGVLLGLGIDLVDVARVRGVAERQGERFLQRIFTDAERTYCQGKADPYKHLAARFAAKEAVSKAFTTGIGADLGWRSVSIEHGTRSEPLVVLDEKGRELMLSTGATHVLVSLSHTETSAIAIAALVKAEGVGAVSFGSYE
jgi:holo-[acyl-carrier protein] synthase